jgi:hypothetical protein
MNLSFTETMRGELKDSRGAVLPVAFHVRTRRAHRGAFTLQGVVHLPGYGDEAPCEGTLTISPRAIAYVVRWTTSEGRFVLRGHKSPSLWSPLASMRRLPIALEDEGGRRLAEGLMWFDVFDLPAFLASWLPLRTTAHRRFDARLVAVQRRALLGVSS